MFVVRQTSVSAREAISNLLRSESDEDFSSVDDGSSSDAEWRVTRQLPGFVNRTPRRKKKRKRGGRKRSGGEAALRRGNKNGASVCLASSPAADVATDDILSHPHPPRPTSENRTEAVERSPGSPKLRRCSVVLHRLPLSGDSLAWNSHGRESSSDDDHETNDVEIRDMETTADDDMLLKPSSHQVDNAEHHVMRSVEQKLPMQQDKRPPTTDPSCDRPEPTSGQQQESGHVTAAERKEESLVPPTRVSKDWPTGCSQEVNILRRPPTKASLKYIYPTVFDEASNRNADNVSVIRGPGSSSTCHRADYNRTNSGSANSVKVEQASAENSGSSRFYRTTSPTQTVCTPVSKGLVSTVLTTCHEVKAGFDHARETETSISSDKNNPKSPDSGTDSNSSDSPKPNPVSLRTCPQNDGVPMDTDDSVVEDQVTKRSLEFPESTDDEESQENGRTFEAGSRQISMNRVKTPASLNICDPQRLNENQPACRNDLASDNLNQSGLCNDNNCRTTVSSSFSKNAIPERFVDPQKLSDKQYNPKQHIISTQMISKSYGSQRIPENDHPSISQGQLTMNYVAQGVPKNTCQSMPNRSTPELFVPQRNSEKIHHRIPSKLLMDRYISNGLSQREPPQNNPRQINYAPENVAENYIPQVVPEARDACENRMVSEARYVSPDETESEPPTLTNELVDKKRSRIDSAPELQPLDCQPTEAEHVNSHNMQQQSSVTSPTDRVNNTPGLQPPSFPPMNNYPECHANDDLTQNLGNVSPLPNIEILPCDLPAVNTTANDCSAISELSNPYPQPSGCTSVLRDILASCEILDCNYEDDEFLPSEPCGQTVPPFAQMPLNHPVIVSQSETQQLSVQEAEKLSFSCEMPPLLPNMENDVITNTDTTSCLIPTLTNELEGYPVIISSIGQHVDHPYDTVDPQLSISVIVHPKSSGSYYETSNTTCTVLPQGTTSQYEIQTLSQSSPNEQTNSKMPQTDYYGQNSAENGQDVSAMQEDGDPSGCEKNVPVSDDRYSDELEPPILTAERKDFVENPTQSFEDNVSQEMSGTHTEASNTNHEPISKLPPATSSKIRQCTTADQAIPVSTSKTSAITAKPSELVMTWHETDARNDHVSTHQTNPRGHFPPVPPSSQTPKLIVENFPDDVKPGKLFLSLFNDAILDFIVSTVNSRKEHATIHEKEDSGSVHFDSRHETPSPVQTCSPTTRAEMLKFFAVCINMSIVKKPKVSDYWDSKPEYRTPWFPKMFQYERFVHLYRNLGLGYVAGSSEGYPNTQWEESIRKYLSLVAQSFQNLLYPGEKVNVGEIGDVLHSKRKRSFSGSPGVEPFNSGELPVKCFVLRDCSTGYLWNIVPYFAKDNVDFSLHGEPPASVKRKIVLDLVKPLSPGHHLYGDSNYTSVSLIQRLKERGFDYTGLINRKARNLPPQLKDIELQLEPGERRYFRSSFAEPSLLCCAWRRRQILKPVVLCSSRHTAREETLYNNTTGSTEIAPVCFYDFQLSVRVANFNDLYAIHSGFHQRCSPDPWKNVFWRTFAIVLYNAFILYMSKIPDTKMTLLMFMQKVLEHLTLKGCDEEVVSTNVGRQKSSSGLPSTQDSLSVLRRDATNSGSRCDAEMTSVSCDVAAYPSRETDPRRDMPFRLLNKKHLVMFGKQRRSCVVCNSGDGELRRETRFYCKRCPERPHLHPEECFARYHEDLHYRRHR